VINDRYAQSQIFDADHHFTVLSFYTARAAGRQAVDIAERMETLAGRKVLSFG
jgi:hypothetical protein